MASPNELFFSDRYIEVPLVPGVVASLLRLRSRFGSHIYLISTNVRRRPQAIEILEKHGIIDLIGRDHVVLCDTDEAKAAVCAALGISHFVDDRTEVLDLLTTVPRRYLFTSWIEIERDLLS